VAAYCKNLCGIILGFRSAKVLLFGSYFVGKTQQADYEKSFFGFYTEGSFFFDHHFNLFIGLNFLGKIGRLLADIALLFPIP
jgi:hypothetical protein